MATTINSEASLDAAITSADAAAAPTADTFTNNVAETGAAPIVTTTAANALSFDGQGDTLTGDGVDAALRIGTNGAQDAILTVSNLNIANSGSANSINVATGNTLVFSDDGAAGGGATFGGNGPSVISAPIYGGGLIDIFEGAQTTGGTTTYSPVDVILNAVNAHTGNIVIGAAATDDASDTGANSTATLTLGTNASIATSASVTVNATGVLDVSSVQTSAGAGTSVAINNLNGAGAVELGQNTLVVTDSAAQTFSGVISSATQGGLTLQSGTLTLSGENTYTGSTRIYGTLNVSDADGGAITDSANVALKQAGASLNITNAGDAVEVHQLTGVAGSTIVLGGNELFIDENVAAGSYSGVISGTGVIVVGPDADGGVTQALTLNGANTYSGGTYVDQGGVLALGAGGMIGTGFLGDYGDFNASASTAGSITVAGLEGFAYDDQPVTLELGSNRLIVENFSADGPGDGDESNFAGVISGSGAVQVGTASATAELVLTGANTYSGSTVLYGELSLDNTASIASSANVGLRMAGAELSIAGDTGAATVTINNNTATSQATLINQLTGVDGSTVALGNENLVVTETGAGSFSGAITGTGDFVVRGPGTLTLSEGTMSSGTAAFTGSVVVGGHLAIANATELADARLIDNGNVDISTATATGTGGAMVEVATLGSTVGGALTLGSNTLEVTGGGRGMSDTYGGTITGAGGLMIGTATAGAMQTLTGASSYTGATTITAGSELVLMGATLTGTSGVADAGTLEFMGAVGTLSAPITGMGAVAVGAALSMTSSSGTLTGADTYSGATTVANGTLTIGAGGSIADSSSVNLTNGTLDVSQAGGTQSIEAITSSVPFGSATATNSVVLGATNLLITGASATAAAPTTAPTAFTGVISGTTGQLQIGAHAGLNLAAAETYTGSTVISGSLFLTGAGSIADSANVSLKATSATTDGLFNISGTTATSVAINELTGQGGTSIVLGSNTLVVDETSAGSYSGVISGTGALTVDGSSYLTLSGADTFSGVTTINGGYLELGTGSTTVTSGNTTTTTTSTGSIADSSGLVDDGFFAITGNATVNDLSGTGVVKTMGNILTDNLAANATDVFSGVIHSTSTGGGLMLTGSGTLVLSGSSDFVGGVGLNGASNLHLEAMNAAGTGAITFETTAAATGTAPATTASTGTLMIDNAALTGGGTATESFANAIHGLMGNTNATIDLTDLSFNTAGSTASQDFAVNAAGTVTVVEGNVSVTLHTDLTSGYLVASSDGAGGTHLHYQAAIAG